MNLDMTEDRGSAWVRQARKPSPDHSLVPPCQAACPLHMDIREYVDLLAQGRTMEALHVIREGNPFPAICAYVCTHPCEDACRRGEVDKPVAIRALKRFAVDFGGDRVMRVEARTDQDDRIAVVGSGPAGLACAYYLRKLGYAVTVFEAHSELGGMMRVGIPQYRLPRDVLDTEVHRLTQMSVEIRTSTRVVSLDLLFEMGYKAVFVTIGAHQSLRMGIEGEESPGVIDGATFLREVNLGLQPSLGESIAVVGGGNVAIDAARTAVRLAAKRVTVLYRRSRAEMPASPVEVQQAEEEGVNFEFLVAPTAVKRRNGFLDVTSVRMELGEPDASGRRRPAPIPGSEFQQEYDALIAAIGQSPQTPEDFGLRVGKGSTIQVDPLTLTTNRAGVFAGGDAVTGPATVTEALATGRLAASRIDDYLHHRYPAAVSEGRDSPIGALLPETIEAIKKMSRSEPPTLPADARTKDFTPLELVYDWEVATNEAGRCLRCGIGAEILFQEGLGKGQAIAQAIKHVNSDAIKYVIFTDADYTYPAKSVPEMIQILEENREVGMVTGNRFNAHLHLSAMRNVFYFGNRLIAFTHNMLNGVTLRDPLTGLRVIRWDIIKNWQPKSSGFDIEVELNHHVERQGYCIAEVEILYRERVGEKKLRLKDGITILKRILTESVY